MDDTMKELVADIVTWVAEQRMAGVGVITSGTLRAEFSDGSPESDSDVDDAITIIRCTAAVLR